MKLHKRWAASWRRSCKQKKDAKYRRGGKTSSPVLFEPIRTFSRVGHGVGQAVDPHFDPHIFLNCTQENGHEILTHGPVRRTRI